MRILDWLLDLFRKKEYYEVNYEELNSYSISFKEITSKNLDEIESVILAFKDSKHIDDDYAMLFENKSLKFIDIKELLNNIKETIIEDYRKSYFEANKENWIFNYFLTDSANIYKDVLLICNKLSYPEITNNNASVIYPLLAVKKMNGYYYYWNLLEKYNEIEGHVPN